jgi:Rhodanese-like domain
MGDFFSSVPPVHSSTPPEDLNPFQQAITRRFSNAPPPTLCTARLQPSTPGPSQRTGLTRITSDSLSLLSLKSPPPPRLAFPVPPPSVAPLLETPITLVRSEAYPRFTPLQASALPNLLLSAASASSSGPSSLIVLDIRGHLAFLTSRITSAMNLSVPTTLLKRPAFSLAKLAEMMPTPSDRERFLSWRGAESIVIYDAETPMLTQGCSILSLLRKFDNEGFTGSLYYIQGGFAAVSRHQQDFIDSRPPPALSLEDQPSASGTLQTRHLPASAFLQGKDLSSTAWQIHYP